jgi:hypothetical protein
MRCAFLRSSCRSLDPSSSPFPLAAAVAAAAASEEVLRPACVSSAYSSKKVSPTLCDVRVRIPKQPQRNNVRQSTLFFYGVSLLILIYCTCLVERVATRSSLH